MMWALLSLLASDSMGQMWFDIPDSSDIQYDFIAGLIEIQQKFGDCRDGYPGQVSAQRFSC